jgi:hypothetical protein
LILTRAVWAKYPNGGSFLASAWENWLRLLPWASWETVPIGNSVLFEKMVVIRC